MAAIPAGYAVRTVLGGGDVPVKLTAIAKVLETSQGVGQVCAMLQYAAKGLAAGVEEEDVEVAEVLRGAAKSAGTGLGVLNLAQGVTAPIRAFSDFSSKTPKDIFSDLCSNALVLNCCASFLTKKSFLSPKTETRIAVASRALDALHELRSTPTPTPAMTRALLDTTALGAFSTPETVSSLAGFISAVMWLRQRIVEEEEKLVNEKRSTAGTQKS
eukprot:TRINITY_DN180_c4_g1_i2.p1 TRINITY_DN180_c4_g1~~TRINITY_DN180_c4_g1_i2.p1  ORF type:complete len:215 (+),score=56.30 TRINITY_DN180_c4_g1_i2:59-703(+)